MQFKTATFKAVNANNSTAIAKFTNAEIGWFGRMGSIYELISASLVKSKASSGVVS